MALAKPTGVAGAEVAGAGVAGAGVVGNRQYQREQRKQTMVGGQDVLAEGSFLSQVLQLGPLTLCYGPICQGPWA